MSNGAMRRATWLPVLLVIVFVIVLLPLGTAAGFEVGAGWNAGRAAGENGAPAEDCWRQLMPGTGARPIYYKRLILR